MWRESGILQYRTDASLIDWSVDENEIKQDDKTTKQEETNKDELWLAARRGSLKTVQKMIEQGEEKTKQKTNTNSNNR